MVCETLPPTVMSLGGRASFSAVSPALARAALVSSMEGAALPSSLSVKAVLQAI